MGGGNRSTVNCMVCRDDYNYRGIKEMPSRQFAGKCVRARRSRLGPLRLSAHAVRPRREASDGADDLHPRARNRSQPMIGDFENSRGFKCYKMPGDLDKQPIR